MALAGGAKAPEWAERMRAWRQGDYTLDIPQILFATAFENGDLVPEAGEVVGLIVISQTCDVVNYSPDNEWLNVAALIKVDEKREANIYRGSSPLWTRLEYPPERSVVVCLGQIMTVHKSVIAGLKRHEGYKSEREQARFASALARKHGRFAFPDLFNDEVLRPLRGRIGKVHDKKDSEQGKTYRSIRSTRVVASPNWDAKIVKVGFIFVLENEERRELARERISEIIASHVNNIRWPNGFCPEDPPFIVSTASEITAQEWIDSQEIDWQFISRS